MVEWRPSAAAGLSSFGKLDSDEPQTAAAAACAAEPGSEAESACKLKWEHLIFKMYEFRDRNQLLSSPTTYTPVVS